MNATLNQSKIATNLGTRMAFYAVPGTVVYFAALASGFDPNSTSFMVLLLAWAVLAEVFNVLIVYPAESVAIRENKWEQVVVAAIVLHTLVAVGFLHLFQLAPTLF